MDCTETIEYLGEYQAGALEEPVRVSLYAHIVECKPCKDLHDDYASIVSAALLMRTCEGENGDCPDAEAVWQRLGLAVPEAPDAG